MRLTNIVIAASLVALVACGSTKNVNTGESTTTGTIAPTITVPDRAQAIASTFHAWNTMHTGGSIRLEGSTNFSSAVNVRMESAQSISISLRPLLGIEVGRLVFTNDSVHVIDKVHKQYIAESIALFTNGLPATVSTLQDIFMGRAFIVGEGTLNTTCTDKATYSSASGKCNVRPNSQIKGIDYEFTFGDDNNIVSLNITPSNAKSQTYTVNYSDVQPTLAGNVAHSVNVAGTIKGRTFSFTLHYNNIAWNQPITIDTTIPNNYKRADLSILSGILTSQ